MIYHVYPLDEENNHELEGTTCKCSPEVHEEENGNLTVIHNSYDGREGLELANELLN